MTRDAHGRYRMGKGDVGVAIPAAGGGRRMGGTRKAFLELRDEPLLALALRPFLDHPDVAGLAIALPEEDAADPPDWLVGMDTRIRIVAGGTTRLESVAVALSALPDGLEVAVVHDAARPLVTRQIVDRCIEPAREGWGAVAGWPVVDTLKQVDTQLEVQSTPDRARFWRAQTPQAFPRAKLVDSYRRARAEGVSATDDAAVFARYGGRVCMVEGATWNLKVTHPEDLDLAEILLRHRDGPGLASRKSSPDRTP